MAAIWTHRLHIIIPAGEREAANGYAAQLDPDTGGALTFGEANLSADGSAPATHILVSTAATDAMLAGMAQVIAANAIDGLQFWRLDAATETLQASNMSEATGQPWSVADTLAAAGLVRMTVDIGG